MNDTTFNFGGTLEQNVSGSENGLEKRHFFQLALLLYIQLSLVMYWSAYGLKIFRKFNQKIIRNIGVWSGADGERMENAIKEARHPDYERDQVSMDE